MSTNYKKSGSAGVKGPQYEIRLCLHFMVGAILNGYHSFQLACNMERGGKFDDIVFRYRKKENDPEKWRLIQAKNTKDPPIEMSDLLYKSGENFDLIKYFGSYFMIKSKTEVQDVVIFTTRTTGQRIPRTELPNSKVTLQNLSDDEDILDFNEPSSKRYKLIPSADTVQDMKTRYMKHIACYLIEFMEGEKGFFNDCHLVLSDEILIVDRTKGTASFRPAFLIEGNDQLSEETRMFQQIFKQQFREKKTLIFLKSTTI